MDAAEWNSSYRVGVRVSVRLVNGDTVWTNTRSEAKRVGQHDFVELEGKTGIWLLSWCSALEPPGSDVPGEILASEKQVLG